MGHRHPPHDALPHLHAHPGGHDRPGGGDHPANDGRLCWHDEAHDGVLEYATLRLEAGALSLFVNVGVELDGRFSARVETLSQCEEVTGLLDARSAKRVALEQARRIVDQLHQALSRLEQVPEGDLPPGPGEPAR